MLRRLMPILAAGLLCGSPTPAEQQPPSTNEIAELRVQAEKGDARAQFNLGVRHAIGYGVTKDEAEAAKWYRKAAEQGNAKAQCNLGFMYVDGAGVPKDPVEAYKWWLLAGLQGDQDAKTNGAILKPFLTPVKLAEAGRRAREFNPSQPR